MTKLIRIQCSFCDEVEVLKEQYLGEINMRMRSTFRDYGYENVCRKCEEALKRRIKSELEDFRNTALVYGKEYIHGT